MTKEKLAGPNIINWRFGRKPFDNASCGFCITQHKTWSKCRSSGLHRDLNIAVQKAFKDLRDSDGMTNSWLRKHYRQIVALRRRFAKCWE